MTEKAKKTLTDIYLNAEAPRTDAQQQEIDQQAAAILKKLDAHKATMNRKPTDEDDSA